MAKPQQQQQGVVTTTTTATVALATTSAMQFSFLLMANQFYMHFFLRLLPRPAIIKSVIQQQIIKCNDHWQRVSPLLSYIRLISRLASPIDNVFLPRTSCAISWRGLRVGKCVDVAAATHPSGNTKSSNATLARSSLAPLSPYLPPSHSLRSSCACGLG